MGDRVGSATPVPHPRSVPQWGGQDTWVLSHWPHFEPLPPGLPLRFGEGGGRLSGNPHGAFILDPGPSKVLLKGHLSWQLLCRTQAGPGIQIHSVSVPRAQGGPYQGLGQGGLILRDERDLGLCAAGHEWDPPGVRGKHWPGASRLGGGASQLTGHSSGDHSSLTWQTAPHLCSTVNPTLAKTMAGAEGKTGPQTL